MKNYLLYALGEVLLIILGVLIALSVADWDSSRKEKRTEMRLLMEIHKVLLRDLATLDRNIQYIDIRIKRLAVLDSLLHYDKVAYSPSMDTLFGAALGYMHTTINTVYYEDLKSRGLDLVKNEEVRQQLIRVFEEDARRLLDIKANDIEIERLYTGQYIMNNFHDIRFTNSATPGDYEAVWNDPYYKNMIDLKHLALRSNQGSAYPVIRTDMEMLIVLIEEYVGI